MQFKMKLPFVGEALRFRAAKSSAAVAAAALVTTLAVAPSAHAGGSNWQHWTPSGNCFGWTTWSANEVQGHVHNVSSGNGCRVFILQWPASLGSSHESESGATALNRGDYANTPSWWHGPAYNQVLIDEVCVYEFGDNTPDPQECSPYYN